MAGKSPSVVSVIIHRRGDARYEWHALCRSTYIAVSSRSFGDRASAVRNARRCASVFNQSTIKIQKE